MIKVDSFISPPQAGVAVANEKGVFAHYWLTWLIGITNAIFLVEDRFKQTSLNMLYFNGVNTTPASGQFWYDTGAQIFYINENVTTGMTLPDLVKDPPLRVEVYEADFVFVISLSIGTVTKVGDVYHIPFPTDKVTGSMAAGAKPLGLHWQ